MPPTLRLSINALAGRRSRTALLVAAVALSTTLIAAVSCALASINAGTMLQIERELGSADVRVRDISERLMDTEVLQTVRATPGAEVSVPRGRGPIELVSTVNGPDGQPLKAEAIGTGIDPALEYTIRRPLIDRGKVVRADDEIVLSESVAEALGVSLGDTVLLKPKRDEQPQPLRVVGIQARHTIQIVDKPTAELTISTLSRARLGTARLYEVLIKVAEGDDPRTVAGTIGDSLTDGLQAEPTELITTGIESNLRANRLTYTIASILAFVAAAFIVLTGMTTSVLERRRELAIMRCIGAERHQLAGAQIGVGAFLGTAGALLGVPFGVLLAYILVLLFPERLPAGLHISTSGLLFAAIGSITSGVVGALYPALSASRSRPLAAIATHARPVSVGLVALCGVIGSVLILTQFTLINATDNPSFVFYSYAYAGLPLMFLGYFLLGVPMVLLVSALLCPVLRLVMRLPKGLLEGSVRGTPVRHGFTAGALMIGVAMLVSIWTNGNALLRDYLGSIEFPEAFVLSRFGLPPDVSERLESLDFVTDTCIITEQKIETDAFGVEGLRDPKTTFLGFEVDKFFELNKLHWVAGDPEYAKRRLREGGAVIVAREFLTNHPEYAIGNSFPVPWKGTVHEFEIVGAVTSPGLDLVSKYFDVGKERQDFSIHSVFGSLDDLRTLFETDAIEFVQIKMDGTLTDEEATFRIREAIGMPLIIVGSGQAIKDGILEIGRGSMHIMASVAIASMLIGIFGVSNIVIAGIDARRFEFGVLRAVGGHAKLLRRLIIAEVLVLTITGSVLGTLLGLQGAFAGQRLWSTLASITTHFRPPLLPIAASWLVLIGLTTLLVLPIAQRLARTPVRQLLFATRG
ncbi:MAG: ABC transporter permease [Phycisphaerales bacterium JB065]